MLKSVIESMGATEYVQVALLLFFAVFMSILVRELMRGKKELREYSAMPLADEFESCKAESTSGPLRAFGRSQPRAAVPQASADEFTPGEKAPCDDGVQQ